MMEDKLIPHVYAELICAWAKGYEIEFYDRTYGAWKPVKNPAWNPTTEYRLKRELIVPEILTENECYEFYSRHSGDCRKSLIALSNHAVELFITDHLRDFLKDEDNRSRYTDF